MSTATMTPRPEIVGAQNNIENEFSRAPAAAVEIQSSRAIQEVRAAYMMAQQFPRDENRAFSNVMLACRRRRLAECAEYEFPRGGERVVGPTVRLAEMLAQYWGHISTGFLEVEQRKGWSTVMAYAVDLQTGSRVEKSFQVEHARHTKSGKKALTDPRDIYEMIANQAMRRVRSCILSILPGDLVEAAVEACRTTVKDNKTPFADRLRAMLGAFEKLEVSVSMLEEFFGMSASAFGENQLSRARRMYQSIADGMSTKEEMFRLNANESDAAPAPGSNGGTKTAAVTDKLKAAKQAAAPAKERQPGEDDT